MRKYNYRSGVRLNGKLKIVGFLLFGFGIFVLGYIFLPVVSYYIFLSSAFASTDYESPVPERFVVKNNEITDLLSQGVSSLRYDYTDARSWFPEVEPLEHEIIETEDRVEKYTLSIPKLEIENAEVSSTDVDLSAHLVQYFSTSRNPTDKGTSVIFGHSTLPQLFDKDNYKTIFAKIHTLEIGDEFKIQVKGKDYTYRIFSIGIVTPVDPNIFSQSFDNSYITLVTCTPPGTVWKRLVLRASLVNIGV